jgi:hypothetical protein
MRLSGFERDLLLLCVGTELEPDFPTLCAAVSGDPPCDRPTFGLGFRALAGAHWTAISPRGPLREWGLVEVGGGVPLLAAPLVVDERVLHFLLGTPAGDPRLEWLVQPLGDAGTLPDSHREQTERLCRLWAEARDGPPVVSLQGEDPSGALSVAVHACGMLGLQGLLLRGEELPDAADERARLARLLVRECMLSSAAIVIDGGGETRSRLASFLDRLAGPVILLGQAPEGLRRRHATLEIAKPLAEEQRSLWREVLADETVEESRLVAVTDQFHFAAADIAAAAAEARLEVGQGTHSAAAVWEACRRRSRDGFEGLAQRIQPRVDWQDLVLPPVQLAMLRDIARQVRHRVTVYESWGFAARGDRDLGISALFAGDSGTGKTLASEVLAGDLGLDLYRIDLSAVVSKYIGETEKNLSRVFAAAEASGAVLLFDEADALFGKRSDVKDSHDRYANLELAYLLQRMEAYRGLAVLTTNLKSLLDSAFLRRIRFVVHFPFPDQDQRAEIWRRMFPSALPRRKIRIDQLSRLHLAGGDIRNIALNAAFLAAEEACPLDMAHLARAARMEFAKLERHTNEAELGAWS